MHVDDDLCLDPSLLALAQRALNQYCPGPGFRDVEARDVVQEAAIRFHRTGARVENAGAWMNTVIRHIVISLAREPIRRARLEVHTLSADGDPSIAVPDASGSDPSPEGLLIQQDEGARLRGAVRQLPDAQREVIELEMQGLTMRHVAEILGIDQGTARVRRFRALKSLRALLAAER